MSIWNWSTTAGNNATADPSINWQEGQLPSTVNNSARAEMAAVKAFIQDQGGYSVLGGSGDAFALTLSQAMTTRSPGLIGFFATRTNVGAVTLAVDSTTAAPLRAVSGTDLSSNQIVVGRFYIVSFNTATTEYIINGQLALSPADLGQVADGTVLSNISGVAGTPSANSISTFFAKTPDNAITKQMLEKMAVGSVMGNNDGTANAISGTATVSVASPAVLSWPTTAPAAETPFYLTTTGALPTGVTAKKIYYVLSPSGTSSNFAAKPGGTAINTSGTQSGVHTITVPAQAQAGLMTFAELAGVIGPLANPFIAKPPFAQGLTIKNNAATPNTKIDVAAGLVFLSSASASAFFSSVAVTINAATTGANALDTGSLANNQEYYVYLISDGTNVAGLLSLSATSPAMPAGYTMAQRFGAFKTDGSANFYRITQSGRTAQYVVTPTTNTASPWMISNASTGNPATPTWTAFAVTGAGKAAPATATVIHLVIASYGAGGAIIVAPNSNYGAYTSLTNPPPVSSVSSNVNKTASLLLETGNISIASNNGTGSSVLALGWDDSVPAV